jgi:hypothetical protein
MLRAGQLLPPKGLSTLRFDAGRSLRRRQPATGPPGRYPDRTSTGWRARACTWVTSTSPPPFVSPVPTLLGTTNPGLT